MVHRRKYSNGTVKVVMRRGKAKWVASINEGTVSEVHDDSGDLVILGNGTAKLSVKWRTLRRTLDVPAKQGTNAGVREAERQLREWRESLLERAEQDYQRALSEGRTFSYGGMTVDAFLSMYFEELAADGREPSTVSSYRSSTARIREYFNDKVLGDVTSDDLTAFERHCRKRGLSDSSIHKNLRILKSALRAHKKQLHFDNPFDDYTIPSPNPPSPNPLDEASLEKLKDTLATAEPTWFFTAVQLALRCGLRGGECCGLRWRDVNLTQDRIHVCNAIGKDNGRLYEKEPKHHSNSKKKSDRWISISPKLHMALERRFNVMVREYRAIIGCTEEVAREAVSAMFVIGELDGTFRSPETLSRTWAGFSEGLKGVTGKRPVFHGLRDSYATYAIASGVDPVTVASVLGHSDPSITMKVYAAVLPSVAVKAQQHMDDIF